ncbi:MAG: alpha/beta hydrolase [Actinobacteria bacterium]|nr:alpha/beta hydrolase [Actinomycetota bacterium]MCB9388796.1 alpha/beta hydrolase [Acidimicrobiia bacterium]
MAELGRQLRLSDGRALGYAVWDGAHNSDEFAGATVDPLDRPVIFGFHGTPGSRFDFRPSAVMDHPPGALVVSVDRPGIGLSDADPRRQLSDFADDIAALADHLGYERFGVLGYSGGGSYALAVAAAYPDRVTEGSLVGALAPPQGRAVGDGQSFALKLAMEARRYLPVTASVIAVAHAVLSRFPGPTLALASLDMPASDRDVLADDRSRAHLLATYREAARSGTSGAAADLDLVLSDWGVDLGRVRAPFAVWQGALDTVVPPSHADWFDSALASTHRFDLDDDGHTLLYRHSAVILEELAQRVSTP